MKSPLSDHICALCCVYRAKRAPRLIHPVGTLSCIVSYLFLLFLWQHGPFLPHTANRARLAGGALQTPGSSWSKAAGPPTLLAPRARANPLHVTQRDAAGEPPMDEWDTAAGGPAKGREQ